MYTRKLYEAKREGDWKTCVALFKEMKSQRIQPDIKHYNTLLLALGEAGKVKKLSLYRAKLEKDPRAVATLTTFNNVIWCYLHNRDAEQAIKLFSDMERKHNLRPDIATYNAMIKGLSAMGDGSRSRWKQVEVLSASGYVLKAFEYFERCVRGGGKPALGSYMALVKALSDAGYWEKALTAW